MWQAGGIGGQGQASSLGRVESPQVGQAFTLCFEFQYWDYLEGGNWDWESAEWDGLPHEGPVLGDEHSRIVQGICRLESGVSSELRGASSG